MSSSSDKGQQPQSKKFKRVKEPHANEKRKCSTCHKFFSEDDVSRNDKDECRFCNPVCDQCGGTLKFDYNEDPPICYYCIMNYRRTCMECGEHFQDIYYNEICEKCMNGGQNSSAEEEEEEESDPEWKEK